MTSNTVCPEKINWIHHITILRELFSQEFLITLAEKHGFSLRKRKINPYHFVALCVVFSHDTGIKSLSELCTRFYHLTGIDITTEGLNQRFNQNAVAFLKELFEYMFKHQRETSMKSIENLPFKRIRILDSTGFHTPTKKKELGYKGCGHPGVKIQLEYELMEGRFLHLDIRDGKENDAKYGTELNETIQPGDLLLRDLGYCSMNQLQSIHQLGGFYVSKLIHYAHIYLNNDRHAQKLYASDFLDQLKPGETLELTNVYVFEAKLFQPRLILYRLTEKQEREREALRNTREKKMKEHGKNRQKHPIYAYITNTDSEAVPAEKVYSLYSLRWQIEIMFKTWKSTFRINQLNKIKRERLDCHLYGALMGILISSSIMFKMRMLIYQKEHKSISEFKVMAILKTSLENLYHYLFKTNGEIQMFFEGLYYLIKKNGSKSKRREKSRPFEILTSL